MFQAFSADCPRLALKTAQIERGRPTQGLPFLLSDHFLPYDAGCRRFQNVAHKKTALGRSLVHSEWTFGMRSLTTSTRSL